MRLRGWTALAAISLLCLLPPGQATASQSPAGQLLVWPEQVPQGGALFVTFTSADAATSQVEFRWQNRSWPGAASGSRYQCALPVSYAVPAGPARVAVTGVNPQGRPFRLEAGLVVTRTRFSVQYLRLSGSQKGLYSYPGVAEEYRAIHEALARNTAVQSWNLPFRLPVTGRLRTSYGLTRYLNGADPYRHKGVDLAAAAGTPVGTAAAGTVALARDDFRLHGQTVVVDHGLGVTSLYLHLSKVVVTPGQQVAAGEAVGLVGATGVATGPHLHWAVYVHGVAVNPIWWTQARYP